MAEHNPDLDERLARLAQRKAAGGANPSNNTAAPPAPGVRPRRRHPAAAGRILSVGLSSSAFLSMVAAFGAQTAASGATNANANAPSLVPAAARARPPKVVVKDVHHVLYVDRYGHPIPSAALPKGATVTPTGRQPVAGAAPTRTGEAPPNLPTAPGGGTAPVSSVPVFPAPAPVTTPTPVVANPTPTTVVGSPPPTAPPVTRPPITTPPTTVVTTPPPPPPPVCSGTKCP